MSAATSTAGLAYRPDPQPDRRGQAAPVRTLEVHRVLAILLVYGRHLYHTLESRAAARGFATIAQFFGTATLHPILTQIYRGLLRCEALDRMLRARAARGFDLRIVPPRVPARRKAAAQDPAPAGQAEALAAPASLTPEAEARAAAARRIEARLARRIAANAPITFDATIPTLGQIAAEVHRSPVGRTIVLICRDFGISPTLCTGPFWNRLFDVIRLYGGSLGQIVLEMHRRARVFEKQELDRNRNLEWPEQSREEIQKVLGFFIGEEPAMPSDAEPEPPRYAAPSHVAPRSGATVAPGEPLAVAAAATGPP